jgi:hypothetical protein
MGAKVEVRGLAVDDENIHRFELTTRDVVQSSGLPIRVTMTEDGAEDRTDLVEKFRKVFVSDESISGMSTAPCMQSFLPDSLPFVFVGVLHDLKVKIVQKLIPKLQKEGYVEEIEAEANARAERRAQEFQDPGHPFGGGSNNPPQPRPNPGLLPEMARPRPAGPVPDFPPPGFEDEHQMNRPPPGGLVMPGGRSPFNIGHDDLNPPGLGPHDPLRGSFVGGGGLPRPGGGAGMHPTFDDPLFMGGGQGGGGYPDQGYDPQAPPGARWDPIGPGGGPRFPGPGSGRGNYPFGGGGGSGGFGGGFGGGGII